MKCVIYATFWRKSGAGLLALLVLGGCHTLPGPELPPLDLPGFPGRLLEPVARIEFAAVNESSGIVKSRKYPGVYWTHNDSAGEPRLFPIRRDGSLAQPEGEPDYKGVLVENALNVDWEDIALDEAGNLLVGDFGNNANERMDLGVYVVPEPDPFRDVQASSARWLRFHFPDQKRFPAQRHNFDCEAVFFIAGKMYFFSKHRADRWTKLYRLDEQEPDWASTPLTLIDRFDIQGMVTGADVTPDGQKLAVLTLKAVWIFERPEGSDNYFAGKAFRLRIRAGQCEGICWNGAEKLLITNEGSEIFEVAVADLKPLSRAELR